MEEGKEVLVGLRYTHEVEAEEGTGETPEEQAPLRAWLYQPFKPTDTAIYKYQVRSTLWSG